MKVPFTFSLDSWLCETLVYYNTDRVVFKKSLELGTLREVINIPIFVMLDPEDNERELQFRNPFTGERKIMYLLNIIPVMGFVSVRKGEELLLPEGTLVKVV